MLGRTSDFSRVSFRYNMVFIYFRLIGCVNISNVFGVDSSPWIFYALCNHVVDESAILLCGKLSLFVFVLPVDDEGLG